MNWEKGLLKDITSKIGSGATPKGGNASYKIEGIRGLRSNQFMLGGFYMSIVPEYRKCKKCGKLYSFNPDVGQMRCPNCYGLGNLGKSKGIGDKIKDVFDKLSGSESR